MKKLLAVISALAIAFSLTACGKKDAETETEALSDSTAQSTVGEAEGITGSVDGTTEDYVTEQIPVSEEVSEELTQGIPGESTALNTTGNNAGTTAAKPTANNTGTNATKTTAPTTAKQLGLNSTSAKEIVDFYKAAAKNTDKNIEIHRSKELVKLDGGTSGMGKLLSAVENVAKSVLADGSGPDKGLRGYPELLTASDIASAKATVNGSYTNITMNIKDYTAPDTGKANEGSVGHAVGVLNTIDEALGGPVSKVIKVPDTSKIKLNYTDAKVTAKIDNKTNKIVGATWEYNVTIKLDGIDATVTFVPTTFENAVIIIRYEAKL